ncbi:MAG: ATP-binding protein [Cyclobacteriaceae bacterium]
MNSKQVNTIEKSKRSNPILVINGKKHPDKEPGMSQEKSEDEILLHSISQNITEAIYRSIHGKGLVYINEAFVKMFGYQNEFEILNQNAYELYKDQNQRKKLAREVIEKGSVTNKEVEFKRKDGSIFHGSFSSTMVVGRDGLTYFDGAIRDISEEKIAEQRLKYQAEMQKVLISISSKYINLPLDSIDLTVNITLKELGLFLGTDRLQIHSYNFEKNECTTSYEWCADGIKSTISASQKIPLEAISDMVSLHNQGQNLLIEDVDLLENGPAQEALKAKQVKSVLAVPMMFENNCVGFVSLDSVRSTKKYSESEITMIQLFANMSINGTTRAQDQKRLHQLLETSIIQKKRLKDFSQITSHNIRTSVANLMAINSLLQDDSENEQYLESLDISVDQLNTSIFNLNHLLNFDNKNEILEKKPCNVSSSIGRVLRHNKQSIEEKSLKISNSLPSRLMVSAFPAYLDEVFHHLISNALRHGTDSNTKKVKITFSQKNGRVSISIADFGKGIDLDRFKKKMFKAGIKFHADSCSGQGMGLFMTKYMVEAMGGDVTVKSKPQKGSTFTVSFPVLR